MTYQAERAFSAPIHPQVFVLPDSPPVELEDMPDFAAPKATEVRFHAPIHPRVFAPKESATTASSEISRRSFLPAPSAPVATLGQPGQRPVPVNQINPYQYSPAQALGSGQVPGPGQLLGPGQPGRGQLAPVHAGGGYPATAQSLPGYPLPGPVVARAAKPRAIWPAVVASALLAGILSSIGTAALVSLTSPDPVAPTQTINIVPPDPGRVDEGLLESMRVTGTYWQEVHAAVAPSVVAIQARAAGTGSVGSGFILDAAGHIVTNNHVITGAEDNQVQITLSDGRLYRADIIGGDSFTDLAVVKLQNPPSDLQPVALGDSNVVQVGDPVLAVGNPLGLANTATTGIVSAINRPVTATGQDGMPETVTNAIQIDAAINPGNSGGPLFDYQGRVIGVNSSIATLSVGAFGGQQGSIGLGFAIPVNLAKYVSAQLIETGEAKHARLGVTAQPVTVSTGDFSRRGARIASVADGTAAAAAGLQVDDVVIAFNGLTVGGSDSLTAFVRERQIGEVIHLTVVREGQIIELVATLGAMVDTPQIVIPTPELTFPPDYEEGAEAEEGSYPEGQD